MSSMSRMCSAFCSAAPEKALWLSVPLLTAVSQIAVKLAAGALAGEPFGLTWLRMAAESPYIWLFLACEIVNFAVWLAILKRHALSVAFSLSSIGYVSVLLASWLFFHEPMQTLQLTGAAIILAGIIVIGSAAPRGKMPDAPL